ncbi:MAG: cysteine hydrolase family protein [Azospirillaceae bacterium]|nr:cysteine hydrolase family protein [Azospirillaceae bacterium]
MMASDTALVIVDLQNDYFPGGRFPLVGVEQAAANAARLLAAARAAGRPVIHVRHEMPAGNPPFFAPGSAGAAIHASVRDEGGEPVITKNRTNAFRDTDLKAILDAQGLKGIVLAGAMSHMCIDAAARAATDLGYAVTVVHDACATRDLDFNGVTVPAAQVHAAFMAALAFAYATVVTTDDHLASP